MTHYGITERKASFRFIPGDAPASYITITHIFAENNAPFLWTEIALMSRISNICPQFCALRVSIVRTSKWI